MWKIFKDSFFDSFRFFTSVVGFLLAGCVVSLGAAGCIAVFNILYL